MESGQLALLIGGIALVVVGAGGMLPLLLRNQKQLRTTVGEMRPESKDVMPALSTPGDFLRPAVPHVAQTRKPLPAATQTLMAEAVGTMDEGELEVLLTRLFLIREDVGALTAAVQELREAEQAA